MRALSIASTGMLAQQTNVEVIANNLANMNTTAFKEQRAEFTDLLYQNIQTPGAQTSDQGTYAPNGIQLGAGVRTAAVYRITTQGDLKSTGNPYDVAIQGPGFFRIQQADGTDAYTRSGNFSLSPQGQVNATVAGNSTPQTVGQLELTRFPNEAGLNAVGNNLYLETPGSGPPQAGVPASLGYGTIQQGFLETSNVNSVDEITALITAQRAYEMNSKVITAADQILQDTARLGS
jgi:flagellar basal-body rod protein FlgG